MRMQEKKLGKVEIRIGYCACLLWEKKILRTEENIQLQMFYQLKLLRLTEG